MKPLALVPESPSESPQALRASANRTGSNAACVNGVIGYRSPSQVRAHMRGEHALGIGHRAETDRAIEQQDTVAARPARGARVDGVAVHAASEMEVLRGGMLVRRHGGA